MTDENTTTEEVKTPEEQVPKDPAPEKEEEKETPEEKPEDESKEEKSEEESEEPEEEEKEPEKPAVLADGTVETPRERGLRLALEETRRELSGKRTKEFLSGEKKVEPVKPTDKPSALSKYKKEDIDTLKEVLPIIADEMGYARKADIQQTDYDKQASLQVDAFFEKHPEYKPENDKDGVLWTRLVNEFNGTYQKPKNPVNYGKLLERVHSDLFGATVSNPNLKENAAREKIKVASHSGASTSSARKEGMLRNSNSGMRFDALKGFSDEEIERLEEKAGQ